MFSCFIVFKFSPSSIVILRFSNFVILLELF